MTIQNLVVLWMEKSAPIASGLLHQGCTEGIIYSHFDMIFRLKLNDGTNIYQLNKRVGRCFS